MPHRQPFNTDELMRETIDGEFEIIANYNTVFFVLSAELIDSQIETSYIWCLHLMEKR